MKKQKKLIVGAIFLGAVLILITLFLLLPRQSDLTLEAPAPPREVTPVPLPPPIPSTIVAKADLPIQDVKQLTESALKDYLSKPIKWKDGAIEASINLHLDALTMTSTADGTIAVRSPFRFNGWIRVSKKILGKVLEKRENFEGEARALLTLTPTLNPDWQITAKTTSDISIQKAELEILGITVSVRRILTDLVTEKVLPKLEDLIVKYITNIDIKTRVAGLWEKLYEPMVLKQTPPIVLIIEPLEILAENLSSDGEMLFLSFGIKTYIQANIGEIATDPVSHVGPRADLPNIHFVDSLESGYHIIAPIEVTYTTIESFAKPHVEKTHKLKGIDTFVENLTLYGSGTQLAVGVGFSLPSLGADGQLYMLGTLAYDATTTSLSVTEFDYSLTTQSLLLEIAEHVGEGIFPNLRTTVEEKLLFPLETELTILREKLSDVIADRSIGTYLHLHGTIDTLTPETLYLTQEGVRVPVRLQGNLTCEITLSTSNAP